LNNGELIEKRKGRIMEVDELTKVLTMLIHWETLLKIDLGIYNERQDCKIGTLEGVTCGMGEGEWRR
jgi:hypothetical protein